MREYETTFIVQPEISDEGVKALCERLDATLEKQGAIRLLYDDQGRRRMAYEIRHFQKGRYILLLFLDDGRVVPEIERVLRLDDSVLRFLTVQAKDNVIDIEARKAEAAELERLRAQRAAERAAREVEEAARLAAEAVSGKQAEAESSKSVDAARDDDDDEDDEDEDDEDAERDADSDVDEKEDAR
jgi:small subunit ribosomal protein S6